MDFSFHLKQGQQLLNKKDSASIKKALEHFREANLIDDDNEMAKPKILYFLALGNYFIGQVEQAYKIAHKAKRSLDTATQNSIFVMDNMREMLGEKDIEELIEHIESKYFNQIESIDIDDDDFDENILDFSRLHLIYKSENKDDIEPSYEFDEINEELLAATFYGMCRTNDELIYFDKLKGDVLSYVEGFLSSHIGDQSASNRRLTNRITNGDNPDYVDEDRYLLIDRLRLSEFLDEMKSNSHDNELLLSFIDEFSISIIQDFKYDKDLTLDDLACSNHILNKFLENFRFYANRNYSDVSDEFYEIMNNSQHSLAKSWIKKNVFNKIRINEEQLKSMDVSQRFALRRNCAQNRDIKSLLEIVKYHFIKGSAATNETNFPELCYYYGRLHKIEELKEFLSDKEFYLFMLPESCRELAENLFNIGMKFPHLSESEMLYLDDNYSDSKTFELFDIIMFDADQLPRPLKKYDVSQLKIKHSEFSEEFLLEVFDCFLKNEELDDGYSKLYVYDRVNNKIIRKRFEDLGLTEYAITQPIHSNEFHDLLRNEYGERCANELSKAICYDDDWEHFITANYFLLNAETIVESGMEYFNDENVVDELKCHVSRLWLRKINNHEYKLV